MKLNNEGQTEAPVRTFGDAIEALKKGGKVARSGWNGKGMWLQLVPGGYELSSLWIKLPENVTNYNFIGMKTAQNTFVPWLASQTDLLAEDWVTVD